MLKVNDQYIDAIIKYLNKVLANKRDVCGVCTAHNKLTGKQYDCNGCPLDNPIPQTAPCSKRSQLRNADGFEVHAYAYATKASIKNRVEWIIKQINKHTSSKWTIYLGSD